MKIGFLKNFALAALAAVTLLACEKDKSVRPTVNIQSDESFNEDHTAQVTIVLSSAIKKDLMINLAVSALSAPGTTAVPSSHLQFPATVTIAAEATSVTFTATLDPAGLSADTYSAGIQVLGGNGYYVNKDGGITYIKFDGSSYSGGGEGEGEGGEGEGGFDDFPEDITSASLQSNWKLTFTETYYDEDDGWLDVLKVTAPGATYLDLTWLDDEDLAEYDDDLDVLNDVQFYDNFMYYEDYASTPTQFFYVDKEDAYYEHEAGTWTVFLIDFNADWTLTGKYGKCTVTIPTNTEAEAGAVGTSYVAKKPLWYKYNRHFISSRAIRKDAPKGLLHNIKRIK